jgi:hypothetical protein
VKKTTEATYIEQRRRELARFERNAEFFTSEYKQYRARKSDLAEPYRIMAKHALSHVRRLRRFIQEAVSIQKRCDQLTLRIAELELKGNPARQLARETRNTGTEVQ